MAQTARHLGLGLAAGMLGMLGVWWGPYAGTSPPRLLGGQLVAERVPAVELHGGPETEDDYPEIAGASGGGLWMTWQSYRGGSDAVWARRFDGKNWGPPAALVEKGDIYRTAVATAGNGETWVVWSQQVGGNWDLYGRAWREGKWGSLARLTDAPQLIGRASCRERVYVLV